MKFNGPRLPDGKRAGFFLGDGACRALPRHHGRYAALRCATLAATLHL